MGIPSFTQGYPLDGSSLGSSKSVIRDNLDGTFRVFSVDHQDQNESNQGYHAVIHQKTQGAKPGTISGVNQVFSMIPGTDGTPNIPPNGDTQLYTKTGMGGFSQLTGSGGNSTSRYVWCSGVLIQYGYFNGTLSGGSTGTVTFAVAFPNSCFLVIPSLLYTTTAPSANSGMGTLAINTGSISANGFGWTMITNSTQYTQFDWIAIGN